MTRKFYKTVIKLVILSEDPIPDLSLAGLVRACEDNCVGELTTESVTELDCKAVTAELFNVGSEPGFFMIDEQEQEI